MLSHTSNRGKSGRSRREEPPIHARRLLAYRLRALSRRATEGALWARLIAVILIGLALVGVWLGMGSLAASDAALGPLRDEAVRDRTFTFCALAALIFAYSTFEVFFRAGDARLVGTLPIRGRTRYVDLMARAVLTHLPLWLPLGAYAAGLACAGAPGPGLYVALVSGAVFGAGLPICVWLHLLAGRSLLTPSSALRRQLAGGVIDPEAGFLLYAPALGLLATLLGGVALDIALNEGILKGRDELVAPTLVVVGLVAVVALFRGAAVADAALHRIMPRFSEVDVPPPFRDDGVRRHVPGERLAGRLPARLRPYFLRDLRQIRRRHRLDRLLLWAYLGVSIVLGLGRPAAELASLPGYLAALTAFVGLLLGSAFRLHGAELASPSLEQTLPQDALAARRARLLADAIYPLGAVLATAAGVAATGGFLAAALVLPLGVALVAVLLGLSQLLARRAYPDRVLMAALAWRTLLIALVGVALWQTE